MIYGVGTGRCGTVTYAKRLQGLHEPEPRIVKETLEYYQEGKETDLIGKLYQRSQFDVPAIIDNRQSWCINLIAEIDPTAEFHWLIREPEACMRSFYRNGAYTGGDNWLERSRMKPKTGFNDYHKNLRYLMIGWYWLECNKQIEQAIKKHRFKVVFTDTLGGEKLNSNAGRESFQDSPFSTEEQDYFDKLINPFWKHLEESYREASVSSA